MKAKKYKISNLAKEDLVEIFVFSISNFGYLQAEHYRDGMSAIFLQLLSHPESGSLRYDLASSIRSFVYKSHIIYYSYKKETIFIERILHHSVDVPAYFKK